MSVAVAMPRSRGFTLIELLIGVVIVALLAAVAIPNYQDHLKKGRRAAAQAVMMDIASKEKQYLLDARTYTATLSDIGVTVPSDVAAYYTITVLPVATPPSFTVQAVPVVGGPQAGDGNLTLTSDGTKSPASKW